jgi:hypothetical protein
VGDTVGETSRTRLAAVMSVSCPQGPRDRRCQASSRPLRSMNGRVRAKSTAIAFASYPPRINTV